MEEVVISGMAGYFPESWDVLEFQKNLMEGLNLVTNARDIEINDKLKVIPPFLGNLPEKNSFDYSIFGMGEAVADFLDPCFRGAMECSFAAICDAGVNPSSLQGTSVATTGCVTTMDSELLSFHSHKASMLGKNRGMLANRIAFHLNLTGPSLSIMSSWAGMLEGLKVAKSRIQRGEAHAAIVVGAEMRFVSALDNHYYALGSLNQDGKTKCFSDSADGFSTSQASIAFFVQKKEDALRSYGTLVDFAIDYDSMKDDLRNASDADTISRILKDIYVKNGIDTNSVGYIEASGMASKRIDAKELNGLAKSLLEGREAPLLVGSVKSVAGHSHGCADAMGLTKALIVANTGIIPPNIHYDKPNSMVPALIEGKLKVVTEPMQLEGDIIGLNAFCITGTFRHCIIKRYSKTKDYTPQEGILPPDGLPRLFCMTGRNKDKTMLALKKVESLPIDPDFFGIAQQLFKKGIKNHIYRGFTVVNDKGVESREIHDFFTDGSQKRLPVWWVFTGMGSQWPGMGATLMKLPVFAKAIHKCHEILKPLGLDLLHIVTTKDEKIFDNILHSFVGIAAVQIGLVDTLRAVGLEPDSMIGHSVGEIGCAYADGCFDVEQTILSAYYRGKASIETELTQGMMAAVGMGYKDLKQKVPKGIEIACHNSENNCTLSGPSEIMKEFIDELKEKGVFARLVNVSNIAYHSSYIRPAGPALLASLKKCIPEPKLRSKKWLSTSVPEERWDTELAKYSSAEYFTNNLLSSVLFEETARHIPKESIIVEISPHGLLQAILKRSFPSAHHIPLTRRGVEDSLVHLLNALGKLYNRGLVLELENIYPPVEYPVARGTYPLSFLINFEQSQFPYIYGDIAHENSSAYKSSKEIVIDFKNEYSSYMGYKVKGCSTIPLSIFIDLALNAVKSLYLVVENRDLKRIEIKNGVLTGIVNADASGETKVLVSLPRDLGWFQVFQNDQLVTSLAITEADNFNTRKIPDTQGKLADGQNVYDFLSHNGVDIDPSLKVLKELQEDINGVKAVIEWTDNMAVFLEALFMLYSYGLRNSQPFTIVKKVANLKLDLEKFLPSENKDIVVYFSKYSGLVYCNGLEMRLPLSSLLLPDINIYRLQTPGFLPYHLNNSKVPSLDSYLQGLKDIISSNMPCKSQNKMFTIHEFVQDEHFHSALKNTFSFDFNLKAKIIRYNFLASKNFYEDNILVVADNFNNFNLLDAIRSSENSYVLSRSSVIPQGLVVIQTAEIDGVTYSFCKPEVYLNERVLFVYSSADIWDRQVKEAVNDPQVEVIYIVTRTSSLTQISGFMEMFNSFIKSNKVRFIFHNESGFSPLLHKEQLKKGLTVNILCDGKWGTLQLQDIPAERKPYDLSMLPSYKLSEVRLKDAALQAFGLTFCEQSNLFDAVEYSAIRNEENICGLGIIDQHSKEIIPDPILQWSKPDNWSHDEIAAALQPYAMAIAIMKIKRYKLVFFKRSEASALIYCAKHPLSMAVIRVTLKEGFMIHVLCRDEEEKSFVKSTFPEIPEENVQVFEPNAVLSLSKKVKYYGGGGFTCMINPLPEKQVFLETFPLLGYSGCYFQAGFPQGCEFDTGMRMFMNSVALYGLRAVSFVPLLREDEKIRLHSLMEDGFKNGWLKPLSLETITPEATNVEAIQLTKSNTNVSRRIVVSKGASQTVVKNWFTFEDKEKIFFIVNPECTFATHLMEWAISKNARNIYLLVDSNEDVKIMNVWLSELREKSGDLNYFLESRKNLKNEEGITNYIEGIQKSGPLASVFIIGREKHNKLETIIKCSLNTRITYFTQAVDNYFEIRAQNGLQVVYGNLPMYPEEYIPNMDYLMKTDMRMVYLKGPAVENDVTVDCSEAMLMQHLPCTDTEVLALGRTAKNIGWKEVRTLTAREERTKALSPILIIPPLKEGVINNLVQNFFNPTFFAVLPKKISMKEAAESLFEASKKFKNSVFTIVCSDWSSAIGINLVRQMESSGKRVTVVFFDSEIDWNSEGLNDLVQKNILSQTSKAVSRNIETRIKESLEVLKGRLEMVKENQTVSGDKLNSRVVLIRSDAPVKTTLLPVLEEAFVGPVNVEILGKKEYLETVSSKDTANFINSLAMVENEDAACQLPPQKDDKSIIILHRYQSGVWGV